VSQTRCSLANVCVCVCVRAIPPRRTTHTHAHSITCSHPLHCVNAREEKVAWAIFQGQTEVICIDPASCRVANVLILCF